MRSKIALNIDMPIYNSKGYRRDHTKYDTYQKKYRKKHLTGNAYYADKRKREEQHV